MTGFAADDWLYDKHRISVGLSDVRHPLVVIALGSSEAEVRALVKALEQLAALLEREPGALPAAPAGMPGIGTLGFEAALPGAEALFAAAELIPLAEASGRIAAETIAPAPPAIPRLIPGQRISRAHVDYLLPLREAGGFFLDPADPSEQCIRAVREH